MIMFSLNTVCVISAVTVAAISVYSNYKMNQQVKMLKQQVKAANTNTSFNCLTRAGIRSEYGASTQKLGLVFIDIDHMHGLNSLLGYAQVDELIKRALDTLRTTDLITEIGQWMSGDEFVITCKVGDEIGLATRLKHVMAELTAELCNDPAILAKHNELMTADPRYGMTVPTFSATYGCVVTSTKTTFEMDVARASAKVQAAKAAGDRGTVNR